MKFVLKLMEEEDIKPDAKLLKSLEKALSDARKNIILMVSFKSFISTTKFLKPAFNCAFVSHSGTK